MLGQSLTQAVGTCSPEEGATEGLGPSRWMAVRHADKAISTISCHQEYLPGAPRVGDVVDAVDVCAGARVRRAVDSLSGSGVVQTVGILCFGQPVDVVFWLL